MCDPSPAGEPVCECVCVCVRNACRLAEQCLMKRRVCPQGRRASCSYATRSHGEVVRQRNRLRLLLLLLHINTHFCCRQPQHYFSCFSTHNFLQKLDLNKLQTLSIACMQHPSNHLVALATIMDTSVTGHSGIVVESFVLTNTFS